MHFPELRKAQIETLQINMGRLCNQACLHCHVNASPKRNGPGENAQTDLARKMIDFLRRQPQLQSLDLTGGAPELNPNFRYLVRQARHLRRNVMVRHNLTVQMSPEQEDLPDFFAEHEVVVISSLPCYLEDNVDKQRGRGVFQDSIEALRRLNAVGYGDPDNSLELHLVYNPVAASLPPPQASLQEDYQRELFDRYGVRFNHLLTITNQPIHRFKADLLRQGKLSEYQSLLMDNFNPHTIPHLMCRHALSLRWDGRVFDCDFNLVQDLPTVNADGRPLTLDDLLADTESLRKLFDRPITVDSHCFACTAGSGSSCGGALVD